MEKTLIVNVDGSYVEEETKVITKSGCLEEAEAELAAYNQGVAELEQKLATAIEQRAAVQAFVDTLKQKTAEANGKVSWVALEESKIAPIAVKP